MPRTYPVKAWLIKDLMKDKNISIAALSRATGKSQRAISNLLNDGTPSFEDTLTKLAAALGVRPWTSLVDGNDDDPQPIADGEGGGAGTAIKTTHVYIADPKDEAAFQRMVRIFWSDVKNGKSIIIRPLDEGEES